MSVIGFKPVTVAIVLLHILRADGLALDVYGGLGAAGMIGALPWVVVSRHVYRSFFFFFGHFIRSHGSAYAMG